MTLCNFNWVTIALKSSHLVGIHRVSLSPCSYLGGRKYERVVASSAPLLPTLPLFSVSQREGAFHSGGGSRCAHWVRAGCGHQKGGC